MSAIHQIYWTQKEFGIETPRSKSFTEIELALGFCEKLRKLKSETGLDISFICMASEIPDCVSLSGVASPSPDYDWIKRRSRELKNSKE